MYLALSSWFKADTEYCLLVLIALKLRHYPLLEFKYTMFIDSLVTVLIVSIEY